MRERELKLAPAPGFRLPDLAGVAPGVEPGPTATIELRATYFDTPDLRLARAGASLRHRTDEGWTVKLPELGRHDDLLVRREHHLDGPAGNPPAAAADLVLGFARTAPLQVVSRLRTRRRRVELLDADGKPQAEVVDDEVSVLDGRRLAARFRELEIELGDDTDPALATAVAERLEAAGAGAPDPTPKIVRALGPAALEPPDVAARPRASGTDRDDAGAIVSAAIAASVTRLVVHDAGVRLGDDPEAVHQARVATRRLRSDLRTFRALVEPEWARGLRAELQWLAGLLGAVRDADVLLERLRDHVTRLAEADRGAVGAVLRRLEADRERDRADLLAALRSRRYLELLDRLVDAARAPRLAPAAEPTSTHEVLAHLARKPWKAVVAAAAELGDDPPDAALHEVRKRAKRARYAAEAAAPVVGKRARRHARALAAVQDVLGDHQDAVVAEEWLRAALATASPRETFVIGQLAAMERSAADEARARWPSAWKAAVKAARSTRR